MNAKRIGMVVGAVALTAVAVGSPASAAPRVRIAIGGGSASGSFTYVGSPVVVPPPYFVAPQPVFVAPPQPVFVPAPPPVVVPVPVARPVVRVVTPGLPDLAVLNYRISWSRDEVGGLRRMVFFEVQNAGGTPSAATLASVSLDGSLRYGSVPNLLPGEKTTVAVDTDGVVSPGMMITIVADCRHAVVEQSKENNRLVARWAP